MAQKRLREPSRRRNGAGAGAPCEPSAAEASPAQPAAGAPDTCAKIATMTVIELWRRGQAGWPRRFPIAQFPNAPLLLALAGQRVAGVGDADGVVQVAGRSVFTFGVGVWAWQEASEGANWFRRLLGVGGLCWVVAVGARSVSGVAGRPRSAGPSRGRRGRSFTQPRAGEPPRSGAVTSG
jgi:hypothetical protein